MSGRYRVGGIDQRIKGSEKRRQGLGGGVFIAWSARFGRCFGL